MMEHQLFPTRVYSERLDQLAEVRTALVSDVLDLEDPAGSTRPLNRTREFLEHRTAPHWRTLFAELDRIVDGIAAGLHPTWVDRSLYRWGLVFRSTEDWPSNFQSIHAHAQTTFSSVCYLQVPDELAATEAGGTLLRNPLANIHHRYYDVDYVRFDPVVLDVVVFPGFLEHLPERPSTDLHFSLPRIVIATDYCYY